MSEQREHQSSHKPAADHAGGFTLESVDKHYDDVTAVSNLSLSIDPGTIHCIVGPNGSGKTTLFRLLLELTQPSAGRIERPDSTVGVGFQQPTFYREFTVLENVKVFGELADTDPSWHVDLLEEFGLGRVRDRQAGALSGGYANKLDVVLAFLDEPAFVLLDEPLGDLDDVTRTEVVDFLAAYRNRGHAVVISTHRLDAFEDVIDRLTVLDRGAVRFDGDASELKPGVDVDSVHEFYLDLLRDGE